MDVTISLVPFWGRLFFLKLYLVVGKMRFFSLFQVWQKLRVLQKGVAKASDTIDG